MKPSMLINKTKSHGEGTGSERGRSGGSWVYVVCQSVGPYAREHGSTLRNQRSEVAVLLSISHSSSVFTSSRFSSKLLRHYLTILVKPKESGYGLDTRRLSKSVGIDRGSTVSAAAVSEARWSIC